jgi:hypothetical protein
MSGAHLNFGEAVSTHLFDAIVQVAENAQVRGAD